MIRAGLVRAFVVTSWILGVSFSQSLHAVPSKADIGPAVDRAMQEFNVPGMAVTVVQGGEVLYARGHGQAEEGKRRRVDEDTLFQIGSVSKAFTAAALALLVDEGRMGWDDRVIDHLTEFRMHDPWVTREFTVRDLLTHRSGLPLGAGDLLMFPEGQTSREEVIRALRHLKPSSSFRSHFDYDNLLYIVAGEVVAEVAGMSFEDFVEQRLLAPLGMEGCVASIDRVPADAPKATPHMLVEGRLETTSGGADGLIAAAGGINCSAQGMAGWMKMLLARGATADGATLISPAQFEQLVGPVTVMSPSPLLAEHAGASLAAYALGWNISTFHGEPSWSHSGGVLGMTTYLLVLPRQNLAVFASGNQMTAAPAAVVLHLAEQFLLEEGRAPGKDWIGLLAEQARQREAMAEAAVAEAATGRAADSQPSLPLGAYAGRYRDPWYGDIHIELADDGGLRFRSERNPPLNGPLEHFQFDTFIARWGDRRLNADAYVSFALSPEGRVERIRMKAVSPATDFSFDFHDLDLQRVE